jgi:hypothetical protein
VDGAGIVLVGTKEKELEREKRTRYFYLSVHSTFFIRERDTILSLSRSHSCVWWPAVANGKTKRSSKNFIMGGTQSKHNAFSGHNGEDETRIAITKKSFCPTLFCPPRGDAASLAPSSRHSSRGKLNSSDDSFGTPIPDTPDAVKRKMYDSDDYLEEEKKCSGGSFNAKLEVRSSVYGGLEKETSTMFSNEKRSPAPAPIPKKNSGRDQFAQIHDGKNAESELYSKYEIAEVLGVGSTSICHRCIDISSGQSRACKIIDKTEIDPQYQSMMDQFYMEIETLRSLKHPNIIQLYDVYISEEKIYIIMELMTGGELFDYVVQKGTLTEEEASRIVRMVTAALVYMHSKNVIHRDLKPEVRS